MMAPSPLPMTGTTWRWYVLASAISSPYAFARAKRALASLFEDGWEAVASGGALRRICHTKPAAANSTTAAAAQSQAFHSPGDGLDSRPLMPQVSGQ